MSEELNQLLYILLFAVPFGLIVGLFLRKFYPKQCKSYIKFSLNKQWKLFLFGAFICLALSITSFWISRPYLGIFFILFMVLELYVLFVYGFKDLTPEQEEKIDSSDPTKIRPFSFWK